ncbi:MULTISPECIES: DUF4369 domain-containing protein [unclassified Leeuwenhoekiella]|uniref:DUF4369 domain-containing protein n=1 Tax=unclassified Leeuwenhoekiella TaxID=2615029 RepID=UPI000C40ADAC|nr:MULTISPECIES: DUF4369 domain-containing protein [unclassified Leeuwenhoekiella]MAW97153.1 hypothetical protein [Leeuwenhoekiella sp.]MBA82669.1 hypothetical protein [Leeuwenhoekiella sp.]|tara:strand:+ start:45542 stop:46303 length:762 start_codon:yes stop_codon:yes gene_type:complete
MQIKNLLIYVLLFTTLLSCSKSGNFVLTGKVNGLRKGILYLQKVEDTVLVNLDSVVIDGDPEFELYADLKEPQVVYLTLEKVDASDYDDRILIFAEPGEMTLNTSLKNFQSQVAITGSENQLKLEEYNKVLRRFNDENLNLIKKSFEVRKDENEDSIIFYDQKIQNLIKRKYLYTVNFAMNNKDYEIAPYLAVSEIFDANVKYLDTIYKSLEPKVRRSKYGKVLKDYIEERENTNIEDQTMTKTISETDSIEE